MPPLVRPPDLLELRSLVAAADLGSIGRAALRLGVSQPALSKRLQVLESLTGLTLLERSARGVALTPEGRRLYEHARRVLEESDALADVIAGLRSAAAPLVLAASHSSTEAFVAAVLSARADEDRPVELVTANADVVRALVAESRAALGVIAGSAGDAARAGTRVEALADDEVVYAVPGTHRWARRKRVAVDEFVREPVVVRDPASNARVTVEAVLRRAGMEALHVLVQAPTPAAALRESLRRNAPVLLSRRIIPAGFVVLAVGELHFPRQWQLVLPSTGEPHRDAQRLIDELRAAAVA